MADIETKEKEPVANEPNTNAAPPVDPVKQKEKKNFIKKIIIFAAILVTFLFLVNSSWLLWILRAKTHAPLFPSVPMHARSSHAQMNIRMYLRDNYGDDCGCRIESADQSVHDT